MQTLEQLLRPEVFANGQRALLLRLLVRRFGPLPESVTRRVAGASTAELERWGERTLDATSVDDVFATPYRWQVGTAIARSVAAAHLAPGPVTGGHAMAARCRRCWGKYRIP